MALIASSLLSRYTRAGSSLSRAPSPSRVITNFTRARDPSNRLLPPNPPPRNPPPLSSNQSDTSDPIADFGICTSLLCALPTLAHRKELFLDPTPPLPSPSHPKFSKALRAKLEICKAECYWLDDKSDCQAKQIKTATLNELLQLSQRATTLSKSDLTCFIEGIEAPLFRTALQIDPIFLRPDDMIFFNEPAWPHHFLNYQILLTLAKALPGHSALANVTHLKKLIAQFEFPDLTERTSLAQFILAIRAGAPPFTRDILRFILRSCLDYLNGGKSPWVVSPSLIIANAIFAENPQKNISFYIKSILPLLGGIHYICYQMQLSPIIDLFLNNAPTITSTPTLMALITHFPVTTSNKGMEFLRLITVVLTRIPSNDLRANLRPLFGLLTRCGSSGNIKIILASYPAWMRIDLEPTLVENTHELIKFVYPILLQAQRESWSPNIEGTIENIFRLLNRIDSFVFQEFCRQRANLQQLGESSLRNWAMVARMASRIDKTVNLGEKLAEIQKMFSGAGYRPVVGLPSQQSLRVGNLPVTTERPLGIRTDLRALIRRPIQ
jgi:hypothetical protein